VIENGKNGYIIKKNDLKEYTAKLIFLMQHTAERKQMAINALNAVNKFSAENTVEKWNKLFEEMKTVND
jgi:glycosyltransferase involved in cell wall biosynthesis